MNQHEKKAGFIVGIFFGFITTVVIALIISAYFFFSGMKADIEALQVQSKAVDMTLRSFQGLNERYAGIMDQLTSPTWSKDAKSVRVEKPKQPNEQPPVQQPAIPEKPQPQPDKK